MNSLNALLSADDFSPPAAVMTSSMSPFSQADAYLASGLIAEAAEIFSAQLNTEESLHAHMGLAQCAYFRRDLHEALGHLQIIESQEVSYPDLFNNLGVILYEIGMVKEAQNKFLQAALREPFNMQPLRNLMDLTWNGQDYRGCMEFCEKILALSPNDAEATTQMAKAKERMAAPKDFPKESNNAGDNRKEKPANPTPQVKEMIDSIKAMAANNYCALSAAAISSKATTVKEDPTPRAPMPDASPSIDRCENIHGVVIRTVSPECDEGGYALDIIQPNDGQKMAMNAISVVGHFMAGTIRAYHCHEDRYETICVNQGCAKIVLVYDRPDSPTQGVLQTMICGDRSHVQITIPPGVYHGWMALSDNMQVVLAASLIDGNKTQAPQQVPANHFGDVWRRFSQK